MEKQTHQTRIGEGTICPIMSSGDLDIHCSDACQWHDGDGCAIWRIVKALEARNARLERSHEEFKKVYEEFCNMAARVGA